MTGRAGRSTGLATRRPGGVSLLALTLAACAGGAGPQTASRPPLSPSPPAAGATAVPASAAPTPTATTSPRSAPPHVMVVVLENREYSSVIGASDAPVITTAAREHGLATRAYAMGHPSEPNYIALLTGSTQGITDDGVHLLDVPSLPAQMSGARIGWRAYMGGLPGPCDRVVSWGRYALKHDPFLGIRAVVDDPAMCRSVVPQSQLAAELAAGTAPPFLWVSPDLCQDGHDCPTRFADAATGSLLALVTASGWYAAGGTVVILWDEGGSDAGCCAGATGGHVAVVVVSAALRPGTRLDAPLDHAGILRGIEELYGLPPLGGAADPANGDLLPLLRPAP